MTKNEDHWSEVFNLINLMMTVQLEPALSITVLLLAELFLGPFTLSKIKNENAQAVSQDEDKMLDNMEIGN